MDEKQFNELVEKVGKEAAEKIKTAMEEAKKGLLSIDEYNEKVKSFTLDAKSVKIGEKSIDDILREQGDLITNMKNDMQTRQPEDQSIKAQINDWMEKNKTAIENIKRGVNDKLEPLNIKAPVTMTVGASLSSSVYLPRVQVAPGIVDLVRNQPTFWDYLPKGRTRANPYVWVNKTNKQGNAQFIGEGVLKPLASFDLQSETSVPKKVAERMKASTELLYDVDGMQSFIEDELRYEVMMAANTAVLTGTASSTNPAGITTLASAFTLTTVETTNPNNADAIRAAIAQLYSLNFNRNIVAFINPIDGANMDLAKAEDSGVYMIPPFTTADGRRIAGVPVIEDNNIAVGNLLIGDLSKYRILMYQDFFINWGWENDDFSKNLVTVIGEMRFHQFMSSNHVGAFIYDSFADIKTAIAAA